MASQQTSAHPTISHCEKATLGAVEGGQRSEPLGRPAPRLVSIRTRKKLEGFKHVRASAAAGQKSRFLPLQAAAYARVSLTRAAVWWSELRLAVCGSGAPGPHTSHRPSVPSSSPFSPAFLSDCVQTGCFLVDWHLLSEFIRKINSLTASPSTSL